VLAGLAIGAGLWIWLTDHDPGRSETRYGIVSDDVSGLSLPSEVRYNGLPVGEVATMALDSAGTGLIRVEVELLDEVPLRGGALARLSTQGVTA
jgi:phospholipid/cholesterol/gamma-HCH transport system substrate-binding protein